MGCYACYNACPKNCIKMTVDSEGFSSPIIDDNVCIKCGRCKSVCPVLTPPVSAKTRQIKAYASYNLDENVRKSSSSGGMFYALAKNVIDCGGVVFGTQMSDDCYSAICSISHQSFVAMCFVFSN